MFKKIGLFLGRSPLPFPFIGLFHIFWLLYTVYDDRFVHFPGIEWLQIVWLVAYTFFWCVACAMKRWGAWGYIAITAINVAIHFAVVRKLMLPLYLSNMFLIDVIFSFVLMIYYTKFPKKAA